MPSHAVNSCLEHAEPVVTMNIRLAYSIPRTTYAAHATFCPFSEVDS